MSFDLRALIRDVAAASASPDPQVVALEVLPRIGTMDREDALWQALRVMVQQVMTQSRHSFMTTGAPISHKVAQIREHWKKMLRDPINLGTYQWKFLGDCTVDDLEYAADLRDRKAVENALRAQQYRNLAKVCIEHKVDTVSGLSESVLGAVLDGFET